MTNLDSVLKSRDITLPTKVRRVKAMVFPVVTYSCESWTVRKAEHQRIDAFKLSLISYFTPSNEFIPFDFELLYICISHVVLKLLFFSYPVLSHSL